MIEDARQPQAMEHLDPAQQSATTESGELDRPRLRRRIDCAGNPEIADRRRISRGAPPLARGADHAR